MSSSSFALSPILMFSALAVAACSNDAPASAAGAPVPGDVGTSPSSSTGEASSELPGPRADNPSREIPTRAGKSKKDPKDSSLKLDPAKMDPTTFVKKEVCLMPKLSMCSEYGDKYERLSAVPQFCAALGGEKAGSCPKEGAVARCITPANVITSYYSSGEKPYTKETAEAKCAEKEWMVIP